MIPSKIRSSQREEVDMFQLDISSMICFSYGFGCDLWQKVRITCERWTDPSKRSISASREKSPFKSGTKITTERNLHVPAAVIDTIDTIDMTAHTVPTKKTTLPKRTPATKATRGQLRWNERSKTPRGWAKPKSMSKNQKKEKKKKKKRRKRKKKGNIGMTSPSNKRK